MAEKTITYIPPKPQVREKRVGIYCRVSTNSTEQLNSLTAQISAMTRFISINPKWLLRDIYIDITSGKAGSQRKEFSRMLQDCNSKDLDIILTKSISRFGRDTVEVLEALSQLKQLGIRVIFQQEELDTAEVESDLMISVIEALAQAENESRSQNIKWGIKQHAAQGSSKLYNRKCFGYVSGYEGSLEINDSEARIVRFIYHQYLRGMSVIGIKSELERLGLKSPKGNDHWCKRTIDVMLSNEKYMGDVKLLDNGKYDDYYLAEGAHQAIIPKMMFYAVQIEKERRSNVVRSDEEGIKRKNKKYSSKSGKN